MWVCLGVWWLYDLLVVIILIDNQSSRGGATSSLRRKGALLAEEAAAPTTIRDRRFAAACSPCLRWSCLSLSLSRGLRKGSG